MDRKITIQNLDKDKIRSDVWEKLFPKVEPLLNTELGRSIIDEDLKKFQLLYERILSCNFDDIKIDDFVELKYLQNRILVLSKRISEYLKLADK
jgi:hypothetical protein